MELYGGIEDSICAAEPLQKGNHLQYAGDLFCGSCNITGPADTWFAGIRNDHPGVPSDDVFTDTYRGDHSLAQEYLQPFTG